MRPIPPTGPRAISVLLAAAIACVVFVVNVSGQTAAAPRALTTEYLVNPIGIDEQHPRLTWELAFAEHGSIQSAYQLQAAASLDQLRSGTFLWDSGKVMSDQSVFVPYGGPAPASGQRVYWRVRAWNGRGEESSWSEPAFFEMGLLRQADWRARWITPDAGADPSATRSAALLRKAFTLPAGVKDARLYVTSLGLYDVRLNGNPATADVLTPGWTSYNKRLQYQVYDVTSLLRSGDNAIGVTLGNGWYRGLIGFSGQRNQYGTQRALLLQLRVTLDNGDVVTIGTDDTWKASTGPIQRSEIYDGETYDARLEKAGWTAPGYDEAGWTPVTRYARSLDTLVASMGEPVRRMLELKPVKVLRAPNGETLFDLGQNMVGWVRLKVRGEAGMKVVLRHAEVLDHDGNLYTTNLRNAAQTDTYILKGGADEVYEPSFTFHGFRYVGVSGYPGEPTPEAITGIVVHSDMPKAGGWVSSNPLLNRLVLNTEWGQRGNFVDIPTDCPQRDERLGWTGDAQVFSRTSAYLFNVGPFFTKWLRDVAADQKPNGGVPWVVPDVISAKDKAIEGAAGWGDAAVVIPWTMYQVYGDRRLLEVQYPSMKAWVDHLHEIAPDGIWRTGKQYGDWLAYQSPSDEARSYPGATTGTDLTATAYFAYSAELLARTAHVLGIAADETRYAALANDVRAAFNREFVTPNGRVGEATQTAYALALQFGLLPQEKRGEAARRLAADVAVHKNHLTTGFLGTPVLCYALSENGHLDTAYALLNQDTYPSWLYPVKQGATTIWERWDGIKPDGSFENPGMNSFNHYAYGAVVAWLYGVVAGIDTDPVAVGYKHSLIRPRIGGGLTNVRATVKTLYGELASAWDVQGDQVRVSVRVPANTTSTVVLPDASLANVTQDGQPLGSRGVQQGLAVVVEVGSGDYTFAYPSPALAASTTPAAK